MTELIVRSLPLFLLLLPLPIIYLIHSRVELPDEPVTEADRRIARFALYGMMLVLLSHLGFIAAVTYLPMFQGVRIPLMEFVIDAPIIGFIGWYIVDIVRIRGRGLTKTEKILLGGLAVVGALAFFTVSLVGLLPLL